MTKQKKSANKKSRSGSFDQDFDRAMSKAMAATTKDVKVAISLRIDSDVYMKLRENADVSGIRYQTLINQILREELFGGARLDEGAIRKIVQDELTRLGSKHVKAKSA